MFVPSRVFHVSQLSSNETHFFHNYIDGLYMMRCGRFVLCGRSHPRPHVKRYSSHNDAGAGHTGTRDHVGQGSLKEHQHDANKGESCCGVHRSQRGHCSLQLVRIVCCPISFEADQGMRGRGLLACSGGWCSTLSCGLLWATHEGAARPGCAASPSRHARSRGVAPLEWRA